MTMHGKEVGAQVGGVIARKGRMRRRPMDLWAVPSSPL